MTIEQKAREIAERAFDSTASYPEKRFQAARLGIIEGLEMAHRRLELVYLTNEGTACDVYLEGLQDASYAIRALIEEQKV